MRFRPIVALIIALMFAGTVHADWPEFRGPTRNGVISESELPVVWSREKNIRWRSELPGEGWSSPVVVGDNVYVTAAIKHEDSDDKPIYDLALLILDANTGKLESNITLFTESPDAPDIHTKNSHASPTPVVHDSRLYLHFGHQGTACTTLDGEVLWTNDTLDYTPVHGNGGSPAVAGNHLIFSRDGADISKITALDINTGKVAWESERDIVASKRFSFCTPLLIETDGRQQIILPGSNVVQSLDPTNGEEFWRVVYDGFSVVPRPVYESGLVFVCTGFMRASVLAIDPTGNGDVTDTHVKWQSSASIPRTPSLVAFDGKITMVSDNGVASSFDALSGKSLWTERIGGNFSASPILAGEHLYMLNENGDCTVLNIADGPRKVAENQLNERSLASPAVVGDDLLIRTSAALYRIKNDEL
jgi:outer membrane protein assembly factor BamB